MMHTLHSPVRATLAVRPVRELSALFCDYRVKRGVEKRQIGATATMPTGILGQEPLLPITTFTLLEIRRVVPE